MKVVALLVRFLSPEYPLRLLVLHRPLGQVLASQEAMKSRLGTTARVSLATLSKRLGQTRALGPQHDLGRPENGRGHGPAQIRFETDLIIEGIRPGRIVRIRPEMWPLVQVPREEYLNDATSIEERFPSPTMFPQY